MKYHIPSAIITGQERTGPGIYLLTVLTPEISQEAQPGQFVHVRVTESLDPLLRRPISICQVDRDKGLVMLWYQVVGKGTRILSHLKTNDRLDIIGPLGNGFATAFTGKSFLLVGGGMGIAPLINLAEKLSKENKVKACWGVKNKHQLPPQKLLPRIEYEVATDDGSHGYQGFVTDLIEPRLKQHNYDGVYACGPRVMLQKTADLTRKFKLPLQVSLESFMACGLGACLGCTCEASQGPGQGWLKVCQDGPVFWDWEVKNL